MRLVLVLAGQTANSQKQADDNRPASLFCGDFDKIQIQTGMQNQIKSNETCGSIDMHACLLVRGIHPPIIYLFNLLIAY